MRIRPKRRKFRCREGARKSTALVVLLYPSITNSLFKSLVTKNVKLRADLCTDGLNSKKRKIEDGEGKGKTPVMIFL